MDSEYFHEWTSRFSSVMHGEDKKLFEKMMSDLNIPALDGLEDGKEPSERLFMTLIFQQQLMINWLLKQVEKLQSSDTSPTIL
jgi:hypothetical protein